MSALGTQLLLRQIRPVTLRTIEGAWSRLVERALVARQGELGLREILARARPLFVAAWRGEAEPAGLGAIERGVWLAGTDGARAAGWRA